MGMKWLKWKQTQSKADVGKKTPWQIQQQKQQPATKGQVTSAEYSIVPSHSVSSSALKWQWKGSEGVEQTYLSSGVWAAMRDRRLLSARGHPDRLKEREERGERAKGQAEEEKDEEGRVSKCEGIERREEKDMSEGKSRMRGIPRSLRKGEDRRQEVNYWCISKSMTVFASRAHATSLPLACQDQIKYLN